jgi:hypothetical protein
MFKKYTYDNNKDNPNYIKEIIRVPLDNDILAERELLENILIKLRNNIPLLELEQKKYESIFK